MYRSIMFLKFTLNTKIFNRLNKFMVKLKRYKLKRKVFTFKLFKTRVFKEAVKTVTMD